MLQHCSQVSNYLGVVALPKMSLGISGRTRYWSFVRDNRNTYAAAIKDKMINRRRPLEFLPVLPLKKGSAIVSAIVGGLAEKLSMMVVAYLFLWSGSLTTRLQGSLELITT